MVEQDFAGRAEDTYQNAQAEEAYQRMKRGKGLYTALEEAPTQPALCFDCAADYDLVDDPVKLCSLHAQAEATAREHSHCYINTTTLAAEHKELLAQLRQIAEGPWSIAVMREIAQAAIAKVTGDDR